jgi:hypothetical protein
MGTSFCRIEKSKHHHLLELPKESTTLLDCRRNKSITCSFAKKKASLAQIPNRRKKSLVWFQKKDSLAPLIVEERIACSIAERKI